MKTRRRLNPVRVGASATRGTLSALVAVLTASLWPASASACAICYGEPDSPAARGLTWAILALGGVVVCVLAGIVGFFVQAQRNSSALDSQTSTLNPPPAQGQGQQPATPGE